MHDHRYHFFLQIVPQLAKAAVNSLIIACGATVLGLSGGTLVALIQYSGNRIANFFISIYILLIRGTPMIVQIVFLYHVLNLPINPIYIAILAIGLNSCAYISQTIKTGIQSIAPGELEAASVMGFSRTQIIRYIILPQAFRAIFPSLGNEFVTLIKDSSLAYIIGVNELFKEAKSITSASYDVLTVYLAITFFYFVMTTTVTLCLQKYEKSLEKQC